MKNVCIVQARMSSSRLPGKVLMKFDDGREILKVMLDRVKMVRNIDEIIVATSTNLEDDQIENLCLKEEVKCYRGSLNNVFSRFYNIINAFNHRLDFIIRLTGDCPIICPKNIDNIIDYSIMNNLDYCFSNTIPDGMDCEVFTYDAIVKAHNQQKTAFDLEHVTPAIRNDKTNKIGYYTLHENFRNIRVTLDYIEDLEVIKKIYNGLKEKQNFDMYDIIDFYNQNNLFEINGKYV